MRVLGVIFSVLIAVLVIALVASPMAPGPWSWREDRARALALLGGAGYGVLARVLFGLKEESWLEAIPEWLQSSFAVMSVSFLFVLPAAIGVLQQLAPPADPLRGRSPLRAFFAPMLPVLLMLAITSALALEGSLCIVMASPALLVLAGIGGLIGFAIRRSAERKARNTTLAVVLLLPYMTSPAEQRILPPSELREVQNVVIVHAAPEVVWREIKSVRAIAPEELSFRVSHLIGLPRPIEATLSHDGVGGVRIATFERGLRFAERVTRWEPGHALSFSITAEPAPPDALDQHVAVGGEYFDVLDGSYRLEPLPDGRTRLWLTSHHRLSTRFNAYAAVWTDFIMWDLQAAIIDVIRKRCER